jgi:hypothetical protein
MTRHTQPRVVPESPASETDKNNASGEKKPPRERGLKSEERRTLRTAYAVGTIDNREISSAIAFAM